MAEKVLGERITLLSQTTLNLNDKVKYSNSLENYCKNPMCVSTISEIESKLATLKSNYRRFMRRYLVCWALISPVIITLFVMDKGLDGLFTVGIIGLLLISGWGLAWEKRYNPKLLVSVAIMGENYAGNDNSMEVVETPDIDHIVSPLGRQLIESITKQGRQMRNFELILVKNLCKF